MWNKNPNLWCIQLDVWIAHENFIILLIKITNFLWIPTLLQNSAHYRSINRQRLVAHSTAMESIQAESEPIDEEEDVP